MAVSGLDLGKYKLGWADSTDDYAYIPLHQQAVVWVARKNIDLVQPADNAFPLRFVTIK